MDSIPPPSSESPGNFYDKKSGFFDNISSEVKERYERTTATATTQDGKNSNGGGGFFDAPGGRVGRGGRGRGRAIRMAEEMKNMQTFGDTGASVGGGARGGRGRGVRGGGGHRDGRGRGVPRGGGQNGGIGITGPLRMG